MWMVFWMVGPLAGRASDQTSISQGYLGSQLLVRATCVQVISSNCTWRLEAVRRNRLSRKFAEGDLLNLPLTEFRYFTPQVEATSWLFLQQSRTVARQWVLLKQVPLYISPETAPQMEELLRLFELELPMEQIAAVESWIRDRPQLMDEACSVLWWRLKDSDPRSSAAVVEVCLRLLDLPDASRANCGIVIFTSVKDARATAGLTRWIRSGEPGVSGNAIGALSYQKSKEATQVLIDVMRDHPSSEIRRRAACAFLRWSSLDSAVVAALRETANDPEPVVRRAALNSLAFSAHDAEAAETLWNWSLQILEGEFDAAEREAAAWGLRNHRGKQHPESVGRMLAIAAKDPLPKTTRSLLYPLLVAIHTQSLGLTQAQRKSLLAPHFRDLDQIARFNLHRDYSATDAACGLLACVDTEEAWHTIEELAKGLTAFNLPTAFKLLQQRREAIAPATKSATAPDWTPQ